MTSKKGSLAAKAARCRKAATGLTSVLLVAVLLTACGGGGGGGSAGGGAPTAPARVVFSEAGNLYAVNADGSGLATLADALEDESVPVYRSGHEEIASIGSNYNGDLLYRPMVQNSRVVYQRSISSTNTDIYAVNLDGTQRVPLAATAAKEYAISLLGDRVIYRVLNDQGQLLGLRSVRLDGSGDVLIDSGGSLVATAGGRVIFRTASGTFITDADGANRVTLWNQEALGAVSSGDRLVLVASARTLVAVNRDGSGFVPLATDVSFALSYSLGVGGRNNVYLGITANRVYYSSDLDSTLRSVGLDGSNPLTLTPNSTPGFPYIMVASGSRLVVNETTASTQTLASYDVTQANSRTLLLSDASFYQLVGTRVIGARYSGTVDFTSVNIDGTAAATLASGATVTRLYGGDFALFSANQLLYRKAALTGQIEGFVINLDGSGSTQITTGAGDKELMGLIGDRLVYQSHATGDPSATRNLHGIRLNGSDALDYATTAADERYLGQFADRVLYTSTSAGTVGLSVVPAAGSTPVPLQSSANNKSLVGVF